MMAHEGEFSEDLEAAAVTGLQINIGSSRPGRTADIVTPSEVETARSHGVFDVGVLHVGRAHQGQQSKEDSHV
jgi:adenine deaminase